MLSSGTVSKPTINARGVWRGIAMSYDVIRLRNDGLTWTVEDPLPLNDTSFRVEATTVHYFRGSEEEGVMNYDSAALHSFTLISPELGDTLVGMDEFGVMLEVATVVERELSAGTVVSLREDSNSFLRDLRVVLAAWLRHHA